MVGRLQRHAWLLVFLILSQPVHAARPRFSGLRAANHGLRVRATKERTAGGEVAHFVANLTGTPGALVDLDTATGELVTIISVVMAVVSIITTIWDFWEKWNAMVVITATLRELKRDPATLRKRYQEYQQLASDVDRDREDSVESMKTVAVFFRLLKYAENQCARPDMHTNWLYSDTRCARDAATARIDRFYNEICSAEYSQSLWAMVDTLNGDDDVGTTYVLEHAAMMRQGASVRTAAVGLRRLPKGSRVVVHQMLRLANESLVAMQVERWGIAGWLTLQETDEQGRATAVWASPACQCLKGKDCNARGWCWVAASATCEHKESWGAWYWSYSPCSGPKNNHEKAHELQAATCTVCNHGYHRNLNLIKDAFYIERKYGEAYGDISLGNAAQREELKRQLAKVLKTKHNISVGMLHFLPQAPTDAPVEQQVYVEIMRYERLEAFDLRCSNFMGSLSLGERALTVGEDRVNEKISRMLYSSTLERFGTAVLRAPGRFWSWIQGLFARAQPPEQEQGLERKDLVDKGDKMVARELEAAKRPVSLDTVVEKELESEMLLRSFDEDNGSSLVELSAEEHLEHELSLRLEERLRQRFLQRQQRRNAVLRLLEDLGHDGGLRQAGGSVASASGFFTVVIWMPLDALGRIVGSGASAIAEFGLNVWWFSFNYIYGVISTWETIGLLSAVKSFLGAFTVWVGIITFFAWLINDFFVTRFNHKICPKISEWIELMDTASPDEVEEGSAKLLARPAVAKANHMGAEKCQRSEPEVRAALEVQVRERSAVAEWLQRLRGVDEVDRMAAIMQPESQSEALLLQQHEWATADLLEEASPTAKSGFCKAAAAQVLVMPWSDWDALDVRGDGSLLVYISRELRVSLSEQACKCPGAPHERCGERSGSKPRPHGRAATGKLSVNNGNASGM